MDESGTAPTHIPIEGTRCYGEPEAPDVRPPAARAEDLVGEQAGSFKLVRVLGHGGMGTVYLGEHALIGSRVAVKVLHPHLASDPTVVQRFFAEARAVNLIGHRSIVQIYDMSRLSSGEWYLVMEHLEGASAASLLGEPQAPERVGRILIEVLAALQAAHRRGIVHRDVKPENVFLAARPDSPPAVKLLDFGIARFFGDTPSTTTQSGVVLGTPAFMSPEQWQGGQVDARSDLYAVAALGRALLGDAPPFLAAVEGRAVTPLDAALGKALRARPDDRYSSAQEMSEALQAALGGGTGPQPAPKSERYCGTVTERGHRWSVECSDLSRAGLFVCATHDLPPVRTLVDLSVELPGGRLEVRGEVVRHVSEEAARRWNMAPGYAVQFLEGGKTLSGRLKQLLRAAGPAPSPQPGPPVDVAAERRLRTLACRMDGDLYELLEAPKDAALPEVRRRGRALAEELAALGRASLGPGARERLVRMQERCAQAMHVLGDLARRAEYDAARRNYLGVARCLAAGLPNDELDRLRARFAQDHPRQIARAQMHQITAGLHESRAETQHALASWEKALQEDPLNLTLHQRYWTLRRKAKAAS